MSNRCQQECANMNFTKIKRPTFQNATYPLKDLADRLSTSTDNVLDAACADKLRLFIPVPDRATICSVHEDAVVLDDLDSLQTRAARMVQAPDPIESRPVASLLLGVDGLMLSYLDCQRIREKGIHRQRLFRSGVRIDGSLSKEIVPLTGNFAFQGQRRLDRERWYFAFYSEDVPAFFIDGRGYSKPMGIDIRREDLLVSLPEIERYLDTLDINVYLEDLFRDGDVVTDRPKYFSDKLNCMIDAVEKYWRRLDPSERDKFNSRAQEVRIYLEKEFKEILNKVKGRHDIGSTVMDFALRATTPVFARRGATADEIAASPSYISPELMALMAAAKRFWGVSTVRLDAVISHPKKEDIHLYLQGLDVTWNDRNAGATLIRPERARLGPPIKKVEPHHAVLKEIKAGITKM